MFFSILLLLIAVRPSYQALYVCNTTAVCGCSTNPVLIDRIVGGENAGIATWSWAVSIIIGRGSLCGGSIISSSWVITAAHCVSDQTPSQITIYAGSNLLQSGTQNRLVSQIIVHPAYIEATYQNDIALLRLSSPLAMNDPRISPICIPSVTAATLLSGEWPVSGRAVVAVGWGTVYENGPTPQYLQQVTVSTVDYRSSTCSSVIHDKNVQFCAGVYGGGKDTCQGDSGGPLMMFTSSNQWVLVGITSYGEGCAQPTSSGVYTRVAAYESWINANTGGSYWPLSLSHANIMQKTVYSLIFFVLMIYSVNFYF